MEKESARKHESVKELERGLGAMPPSVSAYLRSRTKLENGSGRQFPVCDLFQTRNPASANNSSGRIGLTSMDNCVAMRPTALAWCGLQSRPR